MPYITPRGNPAAPIWFILDAPYPSDIPAGKLLSGGMGSVFDKMLREAQINISDTYICCRKPNTDDPHTFSSIESGLSHYHPPFIVPLNDVGAVFLPELTDKGGTSSSTGEASAGQLQKYAGSLLHCATVIHPHYMVPMYGPDRCIADWQERNVTTYIDMGKLREEVEFWKRNNSLRPLPTRSLVYGNLELSEILRYLESFRLSTLLSVDIETVYPRKGSAFLPHPGYPITIGLADSTKLGISFNLFRDDPGENRQLWRSLFRVLNEVPILGQNFFNFDALFLESLGFSISLDKVQDTLIRHHILWPELSHKLQFMTRQYTREPYYKDEGHGWSIKNLDKLRRYNCLDVCVTMEIYEAQEKEFADRPHLR